MDLYEILGVPKTATEFEIKKAFRQKSKELHPDVSEADSSDAFNDVVVAYRILSNKKKRDEYDTTGKVADEKKLMHEARDIVVHILKAILNKGSDDDNFFSLDLIKLIHENLEKAISDIEANIAEGEDRKEFNAEVKSRIRYKGKNFNLLKGVVEAEILEIDNKLQQVKRALEIHRAAKDFLKGYSFKYNKDATQYDVVDFRIR